MGKHNPKYCTVCGKRVQRENVTGFCGVHLAEHRAAHLPGDYVRIATPARKPGGAPTMPGPGVRRYLLSEIIAHTAAVFDVRVADIVGKRRTENLVRPRKCISLIAERLCPNLSYPQIGAAIQRDHSTVMYNARTGERLFAQDPEFRNKVLAVVVRMEPVTPKRTAVPIKRPIRPVSVRTVKPRNDFRAADGDTPDKAHLYQSQIASGSAQLLAALKREMAA